MTELTIVNKNGGAYIDSRQVAEYVGKEHRHMLRDIRSYASVLDRGLPKVGQSSDFFVESSYINAQNKEMPCFLLTKMGCEMVANKLTGEKGVLFTAAYVKRFNEMGAAERAAEIKAMNKPRLSEFNSAVRNVLDAMSYCYLPPDRVMNFIHGVYEPLGIAVAGGNPETERAYLTATEIASILEIFSETGRPHGHAVSAIISYLSVPFSDIAIFPYGLVGVSVKYNGTVLNKVRDWIVSNGYPHDIPHLNFEYHIFYQRPQSNQLTMFDEDCDYGDDEITFTSDELDVICGKYGDCDVCPGRESCTTEYLADEE
jgi:Rha family phage regulatory protein